MRKWIYFLIAVNALVFLSSLLLRKNPVDAKKETWERRQKEFFESELEKEKKARKFQKVFEEYCENLAVPKASQMILNRDRSLSVFVKNYLALRLLRASLYVLNVEQSENLYIQFYADQDRRITGAQFIPGSQVQKVQDGQTIPVLNKEWLANQSKKGQFQKEVKAALEAMNIPLTSRQESDFYRITFFIHLKAAQINENYD